MEIKSHPVDSPKLNHKEQANVTILNSLLKLDILDNNEILNLCLDMMCYIKLALFQEALRDYSSIKIRFSSLGQAYLGPHSDEIPVSLQYWIIKIHVA